MNKTRNFDKWIGILSISVVLIVAIVFIVLVSHTHLAKGTYSVTCTCNTGYVLVERPNAPDGYKCLRSNIETTECQKSTTYNDCPDDYECTHLTGTRYRCTKTTYVEVDPLCQDERSCYAAKCNSDGIVTTVDIFQLSESECDNVLKEDSSYQLAEWDNSIKEGDYCAVVGTKCGDNNLGTVWQVGSNRKCVATCYSWSCDNGWTKTDTEYNKTKDECSGAGKVWGSPSEPTQNCDRLTVSFKNYYGELDMGTCQLSSNGKIDTSTCSGNLCCSAWTTSPKSTNGMTMEEISNLKFTKNDNRIFYCSGGSSGGCYGGEKPSSTPANPSSTPANPSSTTAASSSVKPASSSVKPASSSVKPTSSSVKPTSSSVKQTSTNSKSESTVPSNPPTGTTGIIIAWIIGLFAIGYSFWYFKRTSTN